ncbi:Haloacid dehalogenase-like hydrolase domain-containing protein [Rhynchospora pubera]|uniref:Haloacid dehalogenase-like hydrolase domain-containing protein n=1 Tax=Rhynchospora pubera TaxID=906938 RepID=A0AAV8G1Q5_9POAL|nr:Haloacid dehalogenase-like hydrolase domain-containing protein [Rhynchospora pubera]
MATTSFLLPSPPHSATLRRPATPLVGPTHHSSSFLRRLPTPSLRKSRPTVVCAVASSSPLHALIFDCDGVILESEHLHRQAYNDAFAHFSVRCPPFSSDPLYWDVEFYDELQNQVGGGKPKMRWYFGKNGWPISSVFETPPSTDSDRENLVDVLQDWKTERYKEIIKSGTVEPRPGVLRLMDEAKGAVILFIAINFIMFLWFSLYLLLERDYLLFQGIKLAVCSAATKSSVILCLENLIGLDRFKGLDCFLAGDDVKEKKPDPSIYITAAKKLGVESKNCLVVEDSVIGLQAATGAGMSCIITYTSSTANQDFGNAIAKYPDLSDVRLEDLKILLQNTLVAS